jgi:hypothetical protein
LNFWNRVVNILSPRFLLGALLDEVAEKRGEYQKDLRLHRTYYLDQRALALSSDSFGGGPYVMWGRSDLWRPDSYPTEGGAVLWLRVDSLDAFAKTVLPGLQFPIALVTGESDLSPLDYAPEGTAAILQSDRVLHWFCSQSDISPKEKRVTPIPLGLPYPYRNDIFFEKPRYALHRHITARYDIARYDARLSELRRQRKPLHQRKLLAYGDFALNNTSRARRHGETRAEVAATLKDASCVFFPDTAVPPLRLYDTYGEYAFVISPFGRGLDCYRTWEALMMGAIPIVRRSSIERVFDGLPVVVVDDWREVTSQKLEEWAQRFSGAWESGAVDDRLTLDHWVQRIRAAAG